MRAIAVVVTCLALSGCAERPAEQLAPLAPPRSAPDGPVLPPGYGAIPLATRLEDPRAVLFAADGAPLVLEGEPARLSRLGPDGGLQPLARGGGNGPWTGAARLGDALYVAEAGGEGDGRILKVDPDGGLVPLKVRLPGGLAGPLAAGPDGALYVGVATRAAMGGPQRETPCQDVDLRDGRAIEGAVPCTGAVLRIEPAENLVAVHSWGYRAPRAIAFAADGDLLVADDLRPEGDALWQAQAGVWHGWPDYAGQLASADPQLADPPNPPPPPLAELGGAARGIASTLDRQFGGADQVYVALDRPQGGMIAFTGRDGGDATAFAANLRAPRGLAFSPDGKALLVADAGTGTLWRIAPVLPAGPGSATPNPWTNG